MRPHVKGWYCRNLFPAFTPDLPAKFVWPERADVEGLRHYIDALLHGNKSEAVLIEKAAGVEDVEMFHLDRPDDTIIRVHIGRFVDLLLMRDHFDAPLWARMHFITDGKTLVPSTYLTALGALLGEDGQHIDPSKPWHTCTVKDLTKMGLKPSDVTSSMYRNRAQSKPWMDQAAVASTEPTAPPLAPKEIEVHRADYDRYADVVTKVCPENAPPYFTRRVISTRGRALWVATAVQIAGPWKVWTREPAELMALGLTI